MKQAASGKPGHEAPRIVSHLESSIVKDGDPVTLSCRIIGLYS